MRSSSGFLGPTPCNKVTVANLPYVNFSGPLTVDLPDISPFGAAAFHQARSHPVPDKASGARLATPSMRTNSGLSFFVLWFTFPRRHSRLQVGIPQLFCTATSDRFDRRSGTRSSERAWKGEDPQCFLCICDNVRISKPQGRELVVFIWSLFR